MYVLAVALPLTACHQKNMHWFLRLLLLKALGESLWYIVSALSSENRAQFFSECLLRLDNVEACTVPLTPLCHHDENVYLILFPHKLSTWFYMCGIWWKKRTGVSKDKDQETEVQGTTRFLMCWPLPSLQECRRHRTQWCHCHVVPKRAIRLGEQAEDGTYYRYIGKGMTVFSNNVSEAPGYCNKNLHLPQFRGCEGTMDVFLRTNIIGYKAQMKTKAETFLLDL